MQYIAIHDAEAQDAAMVFRQALKNLLENNLLEIAKSQHAIQKLCNGNAQLIHQYIERSIVTTSMHVIEEHCLNCGRIKSEHTDVDYKCLFDSSYWTRCPESLPVQVMAFMHQGDKINGIKTIRAATGLGLREAKDLYESEVKRHNWGV